MGLNRRCGAAVALLVSLGLGSVGCSGGGPASAHAGGGAGEAPASPSSSPRVSGADGAVAAYRAMWNDLEVAGRTADPDSPQLSDHATGAALQLLKYGLSKDRQDRVVIKGVVSLSPQVVSASPAAAPTQVRIVDCSDDAHWLVYRMNGTLKDDVPGGHHRNTATVQRFGRDWKVVELTMGENGSC